MKSPLAAPSSELLTFELVYSRTIHVLLGTYFVDVFFSWCSIKCFGLLFSLFSQALATHTSPLPGSALYLDADLVLRQVITRKERDSEKNETMYVAICIFLLINLFWRFLSLLGSFSFWSPPFALACLLVLFLFLLNTAQTVSRARGLFAIGRKFA